MVITCSQTTLYVDSDIELARVKASVIPTVAHPYLKCLWARSGALTSLLMAPSSVPRIIAHIKTVVEPYRTGILSSGFSIQDSLPS
jgi:hypothetical protein